MSLFCWWQCNHIAASTNMHAWLEIFCSYQATHPKLNSSHVTSWLFCNSGRFWARVSVRCGVWWLWNHMYNIHCHCYFVEICRWRVDCIPFLHSLFTSVLLLHSLPLATSYTWYKICQHYLSIYCIYPYFWLTVCLPWNCYAYYSMYMCCFRLEWQTLVMVT